QNSSLSLQYTSKEKNISYKIELVFLFTACVIGDFILMPIIVKTIVF
ncbi:MAG: hypothetical protein ACI9J3_001646, partial [Parvicellaceae bacterium]